MEWRKSPTRHPCPKLLSSIVNSDLEQALTFQQLDAHLEFHSHLELHPHLGVRSQDSTLTYNSTNSHVGLHSHFEIKLNFYMQVPVQIRVDEERLLHLNNRISRNFIEGRRAFQLAATNVVKLVARLGFTQMIHLLASSLLDASAISGLVTLITSST